jgi:hypothetical protein
MKKVVVAVVLLLSLALAGFLGWLGSRGRPGVPQFQFARAEPRIERFKSIHYDFLSPSPFEGGRTWVTCIGGTNNYHCFLYDIDRQTILGELINGSPVFMNRDQTELLCVQRAQAAGSLQAWLAALFQRIRHPKSPSRCPSDGLETLWVLDLNRNSATRIGKASGLRSTFQPSPQFRYGYIKPIDMDENAGFLLCDLGKRTLTRVNVAGRPQGWWDEHSMVVKDPTNNFVLCDVVTGKTSPLWSSAQMAGFFDKMNLTADPTTANLFSVWNGTQNDFYLADLHKRWQAVESFLIKVERPGTMLSLVSAGFKFEWSDHMDSTGRWYLYSGRESGQSSSAVLLRDLRNNTDHTLVASDDGKYFSIPRFYRDGVIYIRSNMLWRISLNGSNQARIFPPPRTPAERWQWIETLSVKDKAEATRLLLASSNPGGATIQNGPLSLAGSPGGVLEQLNSRVLKTDAPRFVELAQSLLKGFLADAKRLPNRLGRAVIVEGQVAAVTFEGLDDLIRQGRHALVS